MSAGHVPDQVSTKHTTSAGWRWSKVKLGYQMNLSKQDKRQEGREYADFNKTKSALSLGVSPMGKLSVTLNLSFEEAERIQRDEVDNTRRFGARISWKPIQRSTLAVQFSDTFKTTRPPPRAERQQAGHPLEWRRSSRGAVQRQYYVRYSRKVAERMDVTRGTDDRRENWTVNTGFSLSFGGG